MSEHPARLRPRVTQLRLHVGLIALGGGGGIILNFVSFAFDYVPLRDVYPGGFLEPSWWSVFPCMLLPLLIVIGYALWLARGLLPRWLSTSGYSVAGLSAGLFLASLILDYAFDGIASIVYTAVVLAAFCSVAGLILCGIDQDPRASLIAMQAVYIVQMQFWLAFAAGEFQAGAWLGMATCLAYLAQIILVARRRAWLILLLMPGAVFSIVLLTDA